MQIHGRVALVTGSSRGLGRAIAEELAASGARVAVNYRERRDAAEDVVASIRALGGTAMAFQGDVSHRDQVAQLGTEIERAFGHVDILINNAGAIVRPADWNVLAGDALAETIAVNLVGTLHCIQQFAPKMTERKAGRIVNLTTTYALTGAAPVMAYTAAKAGVIAVTYGMARELGKNGVTVNAVAPGNFDTDMTRAAGDGAINWAISTTPLARLGRPDEIGSAVRFLVESEFINGHVLVVDGGQWLNM